MLMVNHYVNMTCSIRQKVNGPNGEMVYSRLFDDLLHYTPNRDIAKEYYAVGTDSEFLSRVGNQAKFDENGEITFQSLMKLAEINLDKDRVKSILNKDIEAGVYDYTDAIPRLQSFNRNNPYRDNYLATLIEREDGKVELKVLERNKTNEANLNKVIANRSLKDRIMYFLNRAGADVTFMQEGSKEYDNRYSTVNAQRTADGLIQLIEVSQGKKAEEGLAEEAGHFAIGALGKSPLVNRLTGMLTPELQQEIMGEDYKVIVNRADAAREVAGYLVGRAIAGHIDRRAPWQSLVNRIVNQVKKVFYKITGKEVSAAKIDAVAYAEQIAKGFMSPNFTGTAEAALETRETLYSSPDSNNVKAFKSVIATLKKQAAEMRAVNDSLGGKYSEIVGLVETGRLTQHPSMFADLMAVDGITEAMDLLINTLPEMVDKLNSIDYNTTDITPENANILREVSVFVQNADVIIKTIQDATTVGSRAMLNGVSESTIERLKKFRVTLNEAIHGDNKLLPNLEIKQREFFLKFLESVLGTPYISRASRVIFDWKKGQKGLRWASAENVSIEDMLRYMDKDITKLESYLTSMSNSSDVIGQLANTALRAANKIADDMTIQSQDRLRVLEKELHDIGLENTVPFCEVSARTGKLTGNIVSEYVWGDWEDDWYQFKKEARDEFLNNTSLEGKSDFEKAALWQEYFGPMAKSWHKQNSKFDVANSRWTPNDNYKSEYYAREIKGTPKESWLNKYMNLKSELDGFLPEGSTANHRMPQFKGRTMNRIRNRKLFESTGAAIAHTLRNQLAETFVEDSEDVDFGSDQTYNTIEEDMFTNQLEFEKEKINRVPLYGINKLKDMENISTDLFHSTMAYAGMAHTYAAISSISDTLEIGRDVLSRRQVGGLSNENKRKETSNAYRRYQKFLDKQVYGINTPKIVFGKVVWNKVVGFFTGLASKFFLGGNVAGGTINLMTGAIEIFKEAGAGEHFTISDWKRANKEYWRNLPSNWIHAGDDVKQDKVSLFIRQMNALNESKKKERDYFTEKSKLTKLNPFGENLFMPYKCGEHYMQSMAFLAMANSTKLVDSNGNPISLYNAYEVVPIEEGNPKAGMTLAMKKGVMTVDAETGELREWSVVDESKFMDKVREVNNRMHGIYNNQDKTMFQQSWYGNALLAMRGYALGMLQRRIGTSNYSVALGHESEGSLSTLAKVFLSAFTDRGGVALTARAIFLPVSKKVKQEMLNAGFSANQYANMRRNWMDMLVIASLFIMKALFAKGDDDEEDDGSINGILYYAASRLFSEQAAFNTPQGLVKEVPTITNISPVGFSLAQDLVNIAELFITQEEYKSNGATYDKGDLKWMHKVERLIPYYRSYLMMQSPYKAAESYQYGRASTVR